MQLVNTIIRGHPAATAHSFLPGKSVKGETGITPLRKRKMRSSWNCEAETLSLPLLWRLEGVPPRQNWFSWYQGLASNSTQTCSWLRFPSSCLQVSELCHGVTAVMLEWPSLPYPAQRAAPRRDQVPPAQLRKGPAAHAIQDTTHSSSANSLNWRSELGAQQWRK